MSVPPIRSAPAAPTAPVTRSTRPRATSPGPRPAEVVHAPPAPEQGAARRSFLPAAIGAAALSVTGGLIWAAAARAWGWPLGPGAIFIGLAAALPMALRSPREGYAVGGAAVGCAVAGILLAKILIAQWALPGWIADWNEPDPGYLEGSAKLVAWDMARASGDQEVAATLIAEQSELWFGRDAPVAARHVIERRRLLLEQAMAQVEAGADLAPLSTLARDYADAMVRGTTHYDRWRAIGGWLDLLWISIALAVAMRIGGGVRHARPADHSTTAAGGGSWRGISFRR